MKTTTATVEVERTLPSLRNDAICSKYQPLELTISGLSSQNEFRTVLHSTKPAAFTKKDFNQTKFNQSLKMCSMSQSIEKVDNLHNSQVYEQITKKSKFTLSAKNKETCNIRNDVSVKYQDTASENANASSSMLPNNKFADDNIPKLQQYSSSPKLHNEKYRRNVVPPLMPIRNDNVIPRKRRLYNPDSSFVEYVPGEEL